MARINGGMRREMILEAIQESSEEGLSSSSGPTDEERANWVRYLDDRKDEMWRDVDAPYNPLSSDRVRQEGDEFFSRRGYK